MKYLNQINVVLMLLGCVVVVYAFSVTFWQHDPAVPSVTDLPQVESTPGGGNATGSPLMRLSTTSAAAAVEKTIPRQTQREKLVGKSSAPTVNDSARGSEATQRSSRSAVGGADANRVIDERQEMSPDAQEDDTARPSLAETPAPESQSRAEPVMPVWRSPQPPSEVESQKRDQSRNPSPPPVRSSLTGRRPQ